MEDQDVSRAQCTAGPDGGSVTPGLIFGLAVIAAGVLFLLDNFGFPVGVVWRYWPAILIAIGLAKTVDSRDAPGRTGGAIIMIFGVILIADEIHLPFLRNVSLWSLWPLALIAFGVMLFWGALEGKNAVGGLGALGVSRSPDRINTFSIFGGCNRKVTGEFKGADLLAIFGGGGLDLRNATISGDEAVINVNAVFGGFEIRAPETWVVQVAVTGVFGGVDDKSRQPDSRLVPNPKRLLIRGATIFGGLGVKN